MPRRCNRWEKVSAIMQININDDHHKCKQKKGRLGAEIQHKIGQQLRAMYADVVNEGVPDRFAELIQRLDKQDKK